MGGDHNMGYRSMENEGRSYSSNSHNNINEYSNQNNSKNYHITKKAQVNLLTAGFIKL